MPTDVDSSSASTPAVQRGWTHVVDSRTGIAFDMPIGLLADNGPFGPSDLRQIPSVIGTKERQAGGTDVTTSPLTFSNLDDGAVAADFTVAYSQVGGARQTEISAVSVRPVHVDLLASLDLP